MPKLWNETIEEHRRAVHVAILDTAASLVAEHGLTSVTMSQIAQATGIGRATLYKYFPDVESIMMAWHECQVTSHLHQLTAVRDRGDDPGKRLDAVLQAYALIQQEHHSHELAALLHRGEHMARARLQLRDFVASLLADATATGQVRDDIRGHLDHGRQSMSVFAGQSSRQDGVDSPVNRRDMLSIIAQ